MKYLILAIAIASSLTSVARASDVEGPFMVRVRALSLTSQNANSTTSVVPSVGSVTLENKMFPEVDATYFWQPHFATELVLTYPQHHNVSFAGKVIGGVTELPPTLMFQYHFSPKADFRPYAGIGLNYTMILAQRLNAAPVVGASTPVSVTGSSTGLAFQVGFDARLAAHWYLNADAKLVQLSTTANITGGALSGTPVTTLGVNPTLLSLGIGYRF